jgi:hypothetical protein
MAKHKSRRAVPEHVKRAADRAETRAEGKDPFAGEAKPKGKTREERELSISPTLTPPETPKPPLPKVGRPTKYRPEMCERVIELGAQGKSKAQIARDLGIAWSNFQNWMERHPEFQAAIKDAHRLALAHWEDIGQRAPDMGRDFNAVAYIFQMKNRFREDPTTRGLPQGEDG